MLLVSYVLRAHGGVECWNRKTAFSAHLSVSGSLVLAAGEHPAKSPLESGPASRQFVVEGETRNPHLKLYESADMARYSIYTPDRIELRTRAGDLIEALDRPIDSLAARQDDRPLSALEKTFLIGNAIWSAIAGPFILIDARVATVDASSDVNKLMLDMTLPAGQDPLCPRRRLWISKDGVLQRADYEIRHICSSVRDTLSAHIPFDGILLATLRRALAVEPDGRTSDTSLLDMEIFDVRFS